MSASSTTSFIALSKFRQLHLFDRLRIDRHPSTAETNQLMQITSEAQCEILAYDREICKLNEALLRLEQDKRELKSHIEMSQSLLSPIRRLPPEILSEIFRAYCSGGNLLWHDIQVPAMTLRKVCKSWESAAAATKDLYSSVSLTISVSAHRRKQHSAMGFLLSQSGNFPLTVEIDVLRNQESLALALLVQESSRWRSLDLMLPRFANDFFPEVLSQIRGQLSALEQLCYTKYGSSATATAVDIFDSAPNLKKFQVHGSPIPLTPPLQILTLSCTSVSLQSLLNLILSNPQLNELVFDCFNVKESRRHPSTDLHVTSNIRSLEFRVVDQCAQDIWSLLPHLTLPLLRQITFADAEACGGSFHADRFSTFLSRSGCTLTHLKFDQFSISPTAFVALLRTLPSLTHLTVLERNSDNDGSSEESDGSEDEEKINSVNDEVIRRLTASSRLVSLSRSLLPRLTHLEFSVGGDETTDSLFVEMVKSRWRSDQNHSENEIACLKSVSLEIWSRSFCASLVDPVRYLRFAGLNISVSDENGCVFAQTMSS
ncbi:hypothetical protein C8J56DRAFT_210641 [Mycena floridula]|nr:hypothetical protein C8J56DRAFT_210641 [Mycena floridula]